MFISCNSPKQNKVGIGIGEENKLIFFKCVIHTCFMLIGSWKGLKRSREGIVLSKSLIVRVELQKTNIFLSLR